MHRHRNDLKWIERFHGHHSETSGMTNAERISVQSGHQSTVLSGIEVQCRWAAATDQGLVRAANQDAVRVGELVFVVCDGMGGHLGGEAASSIAVDALVDIPSTMERAPTDVSAAFGVAQQVIEATAENHPDLLGMGSTGTVVAVCDSDGGPLAVVANVGDTRAFVVDSLGFRQVTVDHTIVQELVTAGALDPEDVATHPERHVLTRAIGGEEPVAVDLRSLPLRGQARFMLTTDGVHGFVPAARLATLTTIGDPESVVARVMAAGFAEDAPDNLTCLVADLTLVPSGAAVEGLEEHTVPRVASIHDHGATRGSSGMQITASSGE